jgi:hypothetical protein
MPSKTEEKPDNQSSQFWLEKLASLSDEIHQHVAAEQWEPLVVALDLRQQCLEALYSVTALESEALRSLANSILEQDAVAVARIQEHKLIVQEQILALSRGRKALQSYGEG